MGHSVVRTFQGFFGIEKKLSKADKAAVERSIHNETMRHYAEKAINERKVLDLLRKCRLQREEVRQQKEEAIQLELMTLPSPPKRRHR